MKTLFITSGETITETDNGQRIQQLPIKSAFGTLQQALAANRRTLDYYVKNYDMVEANTASDVQWEAVFRAGLKRITLKLYINKLNV